MFSQQPPACGEKSKAPVNFTKHAKSPAFFLEFLSHFRYNGLVLVWAGHDMSHPGA
jgi:hypothetical protein